MVEGKRGFGGVWREGASGGIPGGKPVAVVRMNSARAMSSCWSDQIGAPGARSETPWRRWDLRRAKEGQDRMACLKVCGASEHNGQVVSASGSSPKGCAAR